VQLDCICQNELGNPDLLVDQNLVENEKTGEKVHLANWRENYNLVLLNLKYDLTPSNFLNMIITEMGCIPTTSIPAILREYKKELEADDM